MKILIPSWNYPPSVGGIEQVAHHAARGFHTLGHSVTVLAPAVASGAVPPDDPFPVLRASRPGIPAFLLHAASAARRIARTDRPDWLFCPALTSAPPAWILSKTRRIPYAVCIHGSDILLASRAYQLSISPLLSSARLLFANSKNTAALLEKRGIPSDRIRVVCPGVTPPPPPSARPTPEILSLIEQAGSRPLIISVGRLVRRKGVLEFVRDVLPLLLKQIPDALFWAVGGDPKGSLIHKERLSDSIRAAIDSAGLQNHARLLGRISDADLDAVYRRASLFVLPCLDLPHDIEGFGIVILEAALQSVPSVATAVGGIPDAIDAPNAGLLVPPADPAAMADAIASLLRDPDRLAAMGAHGRQRALSAFTWSDIAAQYANALQSAL